MGAFWSLFLLSAYGVLGPFVGFARRSLEALKVIPEDAEPWVPHVPLLGEFHAGTLAAVILQAIITIILLRILRRPKVVDYLIETEHEMRKVTWPTWADTRNGSFAVVVTVVVMLLFLMLVDFLFLEGATALFARGAG